MPEIWGLQQSDAWLRARCGRITGSQLSKVCSFLTRASGDKKSGDSSAQRDTYRRAITWERLSGMLDNHWESDYMKRGNAEEEPARVFYEMVTKNLVIPVSFIVHHDYSFTGATADGRIGTEGILEIKNPDGKNHLAYRDGGIIPEDYMPQVAWEIACGDIDKPRQIRFADFLSFDRRIQDPNLCYFLKSVGRDELEWEVGSGKEARKLTGEAVIDYFTAEVLKMEAEIQAFMELNGCKPVAPYPVELKEESSAPISASDEEFSYLDRIEMTP